MDLNTEYKKNNIFIIKLNDFYLIKKINFGATV